MDDPSQQLAEYESQLAGVKELLAASPNDESLLALKNDLEELIQLSAPASSSVIPPPPTQLPPPPVEEDYSTATASTPATTTPAATTAVSLPPPPPLPQTENEREDTTTNITQNDGTAGDGDNELELAVQVGTTAAVVANNVPAEAASSEEVTNNNKKTASSSSSSSKKKKKKIKDFVVPPHLIANEEDSEQEKNRKRRALKALKNKWRHEKKEVESANRQKTWQSFQRKTSNKRGASSADDSIFSTREGVHDRVGVISKKTMTDFSGRKRHKF